MCCGGAVLASVVVRAAAWPHLVALGVQRWTLAAWQVVPMEVWPYSFSGSEGGPDSFSLLHLVSGLNGLPRLCSRCQSAVRTCSAPLAVCGGRAVGARLQPRGGRPWRAPPRSARPEGSAGCIWWRSKWSRVAACSRAARRSSRARWWSCCGGTASAAARAPAAYPRSTWSGGSTCCTRWRSRSLSEAACSRAARRSPCARRWSCCGGTASAAARAASAASPRRACAKG